MPVRLKVRSLAKINLDLRVLNKRTDGFHELRTIFQTVSLADTIEIEYQPAAQSFVTSRIGSTDGAKRDLGFEAQIDLTQGLEALIEWRGKRQ